MFERDAYPEDHDPDESDNDANLIFGHQYYLEYQMMSAHYHWLWLHPAAEAVFMRGLMVSAFIIFCICHVRMNLNLFCKVVLLRPRS